MPRLPDDLDDFILMPPTRRAPRGFKHVLSKDQRLAIDMALTTGRALLVRGEPGAGKSQLARAAAVALKRPFVSMVVNAHTEPSDLLWHYDRVTRLANAQVMQALHAPENAEDVKNQLDPRHFITPGPLWRALNWGIADEYQQWPHDLPPGWQAGGGVVALIDEIDKADGSVPSGLLSALGDGTFTPPDAREVKQDQSTPLVVVTTNEDRVLPDAFIRRCLVLHIKLPEGLEQLKRTCSPCPPSSSGR